MLYGGVWLCQDISSVVPTRSQQAEALGAETGVKVLTKALQQQLRDCPTAARELKLQAGCEWGSGGGWGHRWLKRGQHSLDVAAHRGAGSRAASPPRAKSPEYTGERGGAVVNPAKHPAQLSPSRGLALAAPEQGPWEQHQSQVLSTTHMVGFYGRKCHFI